jgi:hypothetical protein
MARKFLRGLTYVTGANGKDIPIFMKLCYEFWSYCVNGTNSMLTVTAASNANPINITTSTPHNLVTNQLVGVYGVNGNTAANGGWNITVTGPTSFNLNGSVGNAAYTNGGTIVIPGGLPISPTSAPAGFFEGASVLAVGNDGVTSAIGNTLTAAGSTPFSPTMAGKHVVVWLAGAATGVAPASAGQSLPQSTINVSNTIGFPLGGGTIFVNTSTGISQVAYTLIPNTTITAGSNGLSLPQSTINVASTAPFPSSGTVLIVTSTGTQLVTYTNTSGGNQLTGCTGGTGIMSTGNVVVAQQFTGCTGGTGVMQVNGNVGLNQPSTDDSIYRILSVPTNQQLQLVPFSGGTPDISTLKNNITSRASLSYRVIDVTAASQLAVASGNYFVGNMNGAPNINAGQSTSQFQFLLRGTANAFGQMGMVASPNGSWNGSVFSGTGSNSTMTERSAATGLNFNGATTGITGFVTMCADTDFFFSHIQSSNSNGSAGAKGMYFMVTTPQRLYTQTQDPNPIAVLVGGNGLNTANGTDSFATSFGMVGFDGITRSHQLITRNLVGDTANTNVGVGYSIGFNLDSRLGYQSKSGQIMIGEALLSVASTAGQFSFARARIRPIRFTFGSLPQYYTVGNSGEFIHLANGLLLPWDGSILPYPILAGGT